MESEEIKKIDSEITSNGTELSKNALKKIKKIESRKEIWRKKKEKKKELKKMKRELSEPADDDTRQKRKRRIEEEKNEYNHLIEKGQRIVIDSSFEDLMTFSEQKSLAQQLMYSYGENRRAKVPLQIHITSFTGVVKQQLEKLEGFSCWKIFTHTKSYIDLFKKEELVYLTADSDTTIETLDEDKIYVIGGIVDRNRYKLLTSDKAAEQGIKTAKLPVDIKLLSSKVLTVNHVVSILIKYQELKDWHDAVVQVIPQRKLSQ